MRKKIDNKILAYSAIASTFLAAHSEAEAQINYTDVDPDTVLSAASINFTVSFGIDFNGDGTTEFAAQHSSVTSGVNPSYPYFIGQRARLFKGGDAIEVVGTSVSYAYGAFPSVLASGDTIRPQCQFC